MSGRPKVNHFAYCCAAKTLRMACAVLALAIAGVAAHAQILYGSMTGTVTDTTGAVIPNVSVTLTDQGTGAVRGTTANAVGTYTILNVLPGVYTLSVARTGSFAGFSQKNISIEPNRQVRQDVTLQPASVSTQITVNEAPPTLQTETAEVNHEISQTQLGQLPMTSSAGRNYQALYSIIPGSTGVQEKNSTASNPSRAMSLQVNGTSYNGNTTRIDGAVNYYGWLPYLIAYVPPADSIENVSITTNDFNAEQGQAGGASIKITTKSGTRDLHGSVWEYYQDAGLNARGYTQTVASLTNAHNPTGAVPKNVFNEYGFNIGGPVYFPKFLTGKKKLFFFDNWERTTRRQLISGLLTVPTTNMIGGIFSEATSVATIYDPAPTVPASQWVGGIPSTCPTTDPTQLSNYMTSGYLNYQCRPSFTNEYGQTGSGVNTIPSGRLSYAGKTMLANLSAAAAAVGTPSAAQIAAGLANDYYGSAGYIYNRTTNDAKITYVPNDNTQVFGKYSVEPFQVTDPQTLGDAGGGTFDGGQPGAGHGRIQNVGLGISRAFGTRTVIDADFGYTRQVSGAQSLVDIADGTYGLTTLKIPGTNGPGSDYIGQPMFGIGTISSSGSVSNGFSSIGNANGANPFFFRDNQFTGDVNLSWIAGRHTMKYGFTYYHFDLNHFQPTGGSYVNHASGGFAFQGNMTCGGSSCGYTAYNALADFLLGLPNQAGGGPAVAHPEQISDPNSLRWTELGIYAQDQWTMTPKFTVTYGVRYEKYPAPYRDHSGVFILDPTRPLATNVVVGGVMGNPKNAGLDMGWGFLAPRLGLAYRLNDKTVVRSGFGLTSDPDSLRYLRDAYPEDLAPSYTSPSPGTIAVDTANTTTYSGGQPMPLDTYGIPTPTKPNFSSGFASLPVSGSTNTAWKNFRRGYLESWNLFIQRDLGSQFVANVGYVGNHFVRQQTSVSPYNAGPLPSTSTPCMANGQYNTSLTGLTGSCNTNINQIINWLNCTSTWTGCYNTGGITMNGPLFSSNYNGLQSQLTRNAGKNASLGVVYTWSHGFDYEDNGAGTGNGGTAFNYPGYYKMNRATASYDTTHNVQVWGIYSLPFGYGQRYANHGFLGQIIGGWQLNGQFSHISGTPFSINANSNTLNAPGSTLYGQLVSSYQQESGHNRTFGNTAVSGGKPWFNPAAFANPTEPAFSASGNPNNVSPTFANTHRNQFRGPGQSMFNASVFRAFHVYRESEFQFRFEAFNLFNHALLNNPNTTIPSTSNVNSGNYGTFGLITSFGPGYSPTAGARSLQFGGRFNF